MQTIHQILFVGSQSPSFVICVNHIHEVLQCKTTTTEKEVKEFARASKPLYIFLRHCANVVITTTLQHLIVAVFNVSRTVP